MQKNVASREAKVALISLPWTSLIEPSLGLSILKAKLSECNIECKIFYLNILMLKYLKQSTYDTVGSRWAINDWLFTSYFENECDDNQVQHFKRMIKDLYDRNIFKGYKNINSPIDLENLFYKIRNELVPKYLNECLKYIEEYQPTMVGFTCMFDQTISSLVLAKLIKEKYPNIFIAMGGYALEGDLSIQIIESFHFIDCVVTGEGEEIIENLAKVSIGQFDVSMIAGAVFRVAGTPMKSFVKKPFVNLNESPIPNYDDFQIQIQDLKQQEQIEIIWQSIPIESSRGCWWGQKNHCTFCGIDDHNMKYRQKESYKVIEMLETLNNKYGKIFFRFSDYILPNEYYKELLPALANGSLYALTCEIKANITDEKARLLCKAGFIEVQPGIESFSTNVLKIMNKGVTAIQNIYTLVLGIKYSIIVHYNILYHFPDDKETDYLQMLKTIPHLYHLFPPESETKIGITRFSPLEQMFTSKGLLTAHENYSIIFSDKFLATHNFDLNNYCYYFEPPYSNSEKLEEYYTMLSYQITYWKESRNKREVVLIFEDFLDSIKFIDTRFKESGEICKLPKIHRDIFMMCEMQINSLRNIKDQLSQYYSINDIEVAISILSDKRVVFIEGDKILGLAFKIDYYKTLKRDEIFWSNHPVEGKKIDINLKNNIKVTYEIAG